jgi:DNA (cytosine-5)-methyltransferase 1
MVPSMRVRRLMPVETERLQGFPDGYTAITWRGKPAADGPRYKAIGNSWAIPPVRWIGMRIAMVETITASLMLNAAAHNLPATAKCGIINQRT